MNRMRPHRIVTVAMLVAVLVSACEEWEPDCDSCPPPPPEVWIPSSADSVVRQLQSAYQRRELVPFTPLLHPDFLFLLPTDSQNPGQPISWGRSEEIRIHDRMFLPYNFQLSDAPVPEELWLTGITIQLTPTGPWEECVQYYASPTNPEGLDSTQVKAYCADYSHSVLFETQVATDYQVTGESYFVVVADRSKQPHEPGAFLLFRWQELANVNRSQERSWAALKSLYR